MAKYNKKIVDKICKLIRSDSNTVVEICEKVKIDEATYYRWKSEKSEFCEAIKKAKEEYFDFIKTEAEKSLVKKIQGYTIQEKRTVTADTGKKDESGKPIVKVKEHVVTDKYFPPDTAAVIFALSNTDSNNWRNKQNTDITTNGKDIKSDPLIIEVIDSRDKVDKDVNAEDTDDSNIQQD